MSAIDNSASAQSGITALFIRRPVLAFVVNTLIAVAGIAAFFGVEIRELPDVDRPVITVRADYPGASAESIDREVTAILEGAVSRVSGVKSISSSSSFGSSRVTVEFGDSADLDTAASDMRDAVGRVSNQLPDDIEAPRIIKADADAQAVVRLAVTSDRMSVQDMTVLVEDQIVDTFAAVQGVADVQVYGDRDKIFRIDINQAKLASLGLTIANVRSALASMSFDAPAGSLTSSTQDLIVRATATVATPEEFENLIINRRVRLGDIATVTLGADLNESQLRANGQTGIGLGIVRQAQSNTLEISEGVHAAAAEVQKRLPEGMSIRVTSDDATFINGAIHEVEVALGISVTVVLLVIFIFLLDFRATIIPGVAIPVALIGTIAAIYLVGFSINILTLLALVLATGIVVDDAIVVLENIVRRRNEGMGPRAAAVLGAREVFFAVIATTVTLMAVFIPLSFLPGQTGGLFREFGFVLAIAVLLSSVVALSLCPMLASRFLTSGHDIQHRQSGILASTGRVLANVYGRLLTASLNAPLVVLVITGLFLALALVLFPTIQRELTPREDRSVAFMRVSAPQGVSLDYFSQRMREIEMLIEPFRESGEVSNTFAIAGRGSQNSGFVVMTLAPWHERERTQQEILADIQARVGSVPGVRAFAFQPNSLGIRGAGNGLSFAVVGNNYADLGEAAAKIVADMEQDPLFNQPRLSNEPTQPQLSVSIDRERASEVGIDISGLSEAMQAMLDGRQIGSVFVNDRSFAVKLVSTTNPITRPTSKTSS